MSKTKTMQWQLISLFLQILIQANFAMQDSAPHWVDVCDGSYLFSEDAKSWFDAVANCELYGSHMLQIDDLSENNCLLEYAHSQEITEPNWWHSGNDIDSEGVYRQADGEYVQWVPSWYGDDPNSGTAGNCLGVRLDTSQYSGKWWDEPCNNNHHYVCEK
eukprot:TRINITY_DN12694_c0_g1_i3.p1 TRINITY_DN12694_c0_g1~~TRINITY_DN12694_c0_g1_i3.p1  ORF type:complete len:160 (-),score=14.56 TRINITY_DN12694_c0_g1_i3:8-487(-)